MKSLKKFTAIVVAFILTFSVLTVASSAADTDPDAKAEIPSYNADDLTYTTMEPEPSKGLGELLGDVLDEDIKEDLSEVGKQGAAIGFDLSNFFRKVMAAILELFDHVNDLFYGK